MFSSLDKHSKNLLHSPSFREFVRFAIVGTLATAIHYGIYLLLLWLCHIKQTETVWVEAAYSAGYMQPVANGTFYVPQNAECKTRGRLRAEPHCQLFVAHWLINPIFAARCAEGVGTCPRFLYSGARQFFISTFCI